MKFLDLNAQYESIRTEVDSAIARVVRDASFILGKDVAEFEHEVAAYCGTRYAVALHSGTDALLAALSALHIGPGDEVITTPFSFFATAEVIACSGAKPVFVDIDAKTFNIDPLLIEEAITQKTRAIMPVHLYGQPANMDSILEIAKRHNLRVIEDAAQAIGAKVHDARVGTLGEVGCFSFFPTKNLGAYGDGGMLVTNDETVATYVRQWRIHGATVKYHHAFLGVSSRLDTLQAAILRAKLPHLDAWNTKRREIATRYTAQLQGLTDLETPSVLPNVEPTYHQYTVRIRHDRRDQVAEALLKNGIPTMVYYPLPLHLQPALQSLGYTNEDFQESVRAAREVLSLPIYPELRVGEQDQVIEHLKSILAAV